MNQVALGILLLLTKYDDHYSYLTSHPTPPPTQPSIGRWPVLSQAEPSINNSVDYSGWDSEGESGGGFWGRRQYFLGSRVRRSRLNYPVPNETPFFPSNADFNWISSA